MKKVEHFLEALIFNSRWLLVPYYLGLVLAIALLLVKFVKEFIGFVGMVFTGSGTDVVIGILTLIDVVLLSNLLLIIIFAGYENFVSKIDPIRVRFSIDERRFIMFAREFAKNVDPVDKDEENNDAICFNYWNFSHPTVFLGRNENENQRGYQYRSRLSGAVSFSCH